MPSAPFLSKSKSFVWALLAGALSLAASTGAYLFLGFGDPTAPDGRFYMAIADRLAAHGDLLSYIDPSSPWGEVPSYARPPGWPLLLSAVFALFRPENLPFAVQVTAMGLVAVSAMLALYLFESLSIPRWMCFAGAVLIGVHPTLLYLAQVGMSEPCASFVLILAALLVMKGRLFRYPGFFLLGFLCLVRPPCLALAPFVLAYCVFEWKRHSTYPARILSPIALALAFFLPVTFWMGRNYVMFGAPTLSSLSGETMYGATNIKVATDLDVWGYWVFPNEIPGETAKRELAARLGERELDHYYSERAKEFMRTSPKLVPRLILGRFIRGFVPVPWQGDLGATAGSIYRAFILVGALLAAATGAFRKLPWQYNLISLGMLFVTVVTTLGFYGTPRFSSVLEVLLVPYTLLGWAAALSQLMSRRRLAVP